MTPTKVVDQESVYDTVHHEAVTETKYVVDSVAWVENLEHAAEYTTTYVVITPAWVETVSDGWVCEGCAASIQITTIYNISL